MNVDDLLEELEERGVSRNRYALVRRDGPAYGRGSTTQLILKPVDEGWEVWTADRASYFPKARFATDKQSLSDTSSPSKLQDAGVAENDKETL